MKKELIIYQSKNGALEFKGDFKKETIWATQSQIAEVFDVNVRTISEHLINIFKSKELSKDSVIRNFRNTAVDGKTYNTQFYNLDAIISVGYRVNSQTATYFRQWATKTLREHIIKGYTLNKKVLAKNYSDFLQAVESVKKLLPKGGQVKAEDALELVKMFAHTWLSLDAYDKETLPKTGTRKKQIAITAAALQNALQELRNNLLGKKEAGELFGQERQKGAVQSIVGSVFQTTFGQDAYPTIEEKSAHLLYFMVKNHPFIDGNKRSGAFAFVWFLNKTGMLEKGKITPEALTVLTLLVAESNPKDKEKMIGLVLQLLK